MQPKAQASFEYSFIPAQPLAGRPFGLVILLNYLDAEVKIKAMTYLWIIIEGLCVSFVWSLKMQRDGAA